MFFETALASGNKICLVHAVAEYAGREDDSPLSPTVLFPAANILFYILYFQTKENH